MSTRPFIALSSTDAKGHPRVALLFGARRASRFLNAPDGFDLDMAGHQQQMRQTFGIIRMHVFRKCGQPFIVGI